MSGGESDLTGEWIGLFNYPKLLPTTQFHVTLRDAGGSVSGITSEDGEGLGRSGTVHAVIEGSHKGGALSFIKIYDDLDHAVHPVHYQGAIASGGDEIAGRWEIQGEWSGTFIMIRNPGVSEAAERSVSLEVRII